MGGVAKVIAVRSTPSRYAQATIIGFDRAMNTTLRFVEKLFQRDRFPTPIRTAIASHLKSGS
jgi:hypothetical protein